MNIKRWKSKLLISLPLLVNLISPMGIVSCSAPRVIDTDSLFATPAARASGAGKWDNVYANNPGLAGVEILVQQLEGPYISPEYTGMHPAEIFYHFWDGTIRWMSYLPDGTTTNDQWLYNDHKRRLQNCMKLTGGERAQRLRSALALENSNKVNSWTSVDFSYGSDPTLSRHADPRRVLQDKLEASERSH